MTTRRLCGAWDGLGSEVAVEGRAGTAVGGAGGPDDRPSPGRRSRLTPEQKAELAAWVEAGPDPERDGVVGWRRIDLKRRIQAGFGVVMHERSVGKQLRALGLRRLVPRPKHPKADFAAREAFRKTFPKP
jgi:transposase